MDHVAHREEPRAEDARRFTIESFQPVASAGDRGFELSRGAQRRGASPSAGETALAGAAAREASRSHRPANGNAEAPHTGARGPGRAPRCFSHGAGTGAARPVPAVLFARARRGIDARSLRPLRGPAIEARARQHAILVGIAAWHLQRLLHDRFRRQAPTSRDVARLAGCPAGDGVARLLQTRRWCSRPRARAVLDAIAQSGYAPNRPRARCAQAPASSRWWSPTSRSIRSIRQMLQLLSAAAASVASRLRSTRKRTSATFDHTRDGRELRGRRHHHHGRPRPRCRCSERIAQKVPLVLLAPHRGVRCLRPVLERQPRERSLDRGLLRGPRAHADRPDLGARPAEHLREREQASSRSSRGAASR